MRNPLIGTFVSRCKALVLLTGVVMMSAAAGSVAEAKPISLDEPFAREYVRGSGRDITFTVDADLPEGSYVLARAWSETDRAMVLPFRHRIDGEPWVIKSEMLDRIPNGYANVVVYLHRPNRAPVNDKRQIRMRPGASDETTDVPTDPGEEPVSGEVASKAFFPANMAKTYETYSGVDIPLTLNGTLEPGAFVRVRAWNNDLKKMMDDVFKFDIKPGDPLVIDSSKLNRLPEGNTKLVLFFFKPGAVRGRNKTGVWVRIAKGDGSTQPAPEEEPVDEPSTDDPVDSTFATIAQFDARLPSSYTTGSGVSIPFVVNGDMEEGSYVRIRSWSNESRQMVTAFKHDMTQGPWQIASSQLDKLPEGLNLLSLRLFRKDGSYVNKKGWVTVLGGATGVGETPTQDDPPVVDSGDGTNQPPVVDSGSGGSGSGSGSGDDAGGPNPGEWPSDGVRQPSGFLAINVDEPMYWSRAWVFTDIMDQATWRDGSQSFIAFADADGRYPKGTYTVVPAEAATVSVGNKLTIKPNPGYENGNFSVYMPGFGPGQSGHGQQFHPLYLERLKPFKTIRFMQWQQTNNVNDAAGKWSNRITLNDRRVGGKLAARVPIEHMVDLVNALQADPWFCMPHTFDDDYVRNFAKLVKGRIHSDATIYVEFSNELWNSPFGQSRWIRDASGRIDHDRWAERIKRVRTLWREVFGSDADRVVMVLAAQETNPWHTEQLTQRLVEGSKRHFDVLATTAYFGGSATSIDEVFEDIRGKRRDRRIAQGKLARDYGVPYITYEAGPHDLKQDQSWHDSDRMYEAMIENMKTLEEAGGQMYNAFLFIGPPSDAFGFWGHLEYMDESLDEAPKFKALIDYPTSDERLQLSSFD